MFSVLPTASCLAIGAPEARNGSSCSPLRAPRHLGAYMGPVVVLQYADKNVDCGWRRGGTLREWGRLRVGGVGRAGQSGEVSKLERNN